MTAKSAADVIWREGSAATPADLMDRSSPASAVPASVELEPARPSRWLSRRRLVLAGLQIAVLAVSAAVLFGLVRKVDPGTVISRAGHVSWWLVGLAIALNLPTTLLRARRTQILLARLGHHVPFGRMNGVDLAGQTLSWLTPAASGDLSRPYLWRNGDGTPVSAGVATVLYERLVTLLQLGVIGGLLAAVIYLPPGAVAGISVLALALLAAPWWASRLTHRLAHRDLSGSRPGVRTGVVRSLVRLHELGTSPRLTAAFAGYTLLIFLISGLQIVVLAGAVGSGLGLWVAVSAYCISQAAGSVSTLPFGLGAADVVTLNLLIAGGLGHDAAVVVTLLVRLAMTLPLGIGGAIGIVLLGRPRIPDEEHAMATASP